MIDFTPLESKISYTFTDRDLLQQVFVHRSFLNEHKQFPLGHNERLEFLGDAVLELVVTDHLYRTYLEPEGELTAYRSALVKGEMLAQIATEYSFPDYIMVSRGEAKSGGQNKGYLLANALEAFIGALHLDGGYEVASRFIHEAILSKLPFILEHKLHQDPKSKFQEYAQQNLGGTPSYEIVSESGPDHAKTFVVTVQVQGREMGIGSGSSKQAAQVAAAGDAITKLNI